MLLCVAALQCLGQKTFRRLVRCLRKTHDLIIRQHFAIFCLSKVWLLLRSIAMFNSLGSHKVALKVVFIVCMYRNVTQPCVPSLIPSVHPSQTTHHMQLSCMAIDLLSNQPNWTNQLLVALFNLSDSHKVAFSGHKFVLCLLQDPDRETLNSNTGAE